MKAAVISGGTKGLGRALSLAFGQEGYAVLSLYRDDDQAAAAFAQEAAARGIKRLLTRRQDVADEEAARSLASADEIVGAESLVLVNNACAPFSPRPLHLLSWVDFHEQISTTLQGSFVLTRALLRALVARQGLVVNVLTSAMESPPRGFGAYGSAKHALLGLTRSLHAEYGGQGLRVLSVSPGFMDTPLTAAWNPALREAMMKGAQSSVDDVARFVVDLAAGGKEGVGFGDNPRP